MRCWSVRRPARKLSTLSMHLWRRASSFTSVMVWDTLWMMSSRNSGGSTKFSSPLSKWRPVFLNLHESDKILGRRWSTAGISLVYSHSGLLVVEAAHQLAVDEGGEDLGEEPVCLVGVEALQDPDHLLPPLLVGAVEPDLVHVLPGKVQLVLRLLQDLLDLLLLGCLLKVTKK